MLSGRGIDGELKSKFGEWSEKFWKSSSWGNPIQAKNFQAIYFANEGGGSDGGGKELKKLGSNGGEKLLKEAGEKVERFFGYCVGGRNENGSGCKKNDNNASVVMVGGDGWNESSLKNEFSSNWDKNNSWRLIESGKNYKNVFGKFNSNSGSRSGDGKLNGAKLCGLIIKRQIESTVKEQLFSWVRERTGVGLNNTNYRNCRGGWQSVDDDKRPILTQFLSSTEAKSYFDNNSWKKYSDAGPYFALLTLIDLFSNSLANIEYEKSWSEINNENGKILKSLFEQNSKFVYLSSSKNDNNLESVTLHSDGAWGLTFCKENNCDNENDLKISVSRNQFCISGKVCFGKNSNPARLGNFGSQWNNLHNSGPALWTKVVGNQNYEGVWRNFLLGLISACFGEEEKVSLSISANPEKGKMLLKKLN